MLDAITESINSINGSRVVWRAFLSPPQGSEDALGLHSVTFRERPVRNKKLPGSPRE